MDLMSRKQQLPTHMGKAPAHQRMSVADTDAGCSLRMAPIGELQSRPSGSWSKYMTSSADNYSPFKKLLLASYYTLVQHERLTRVLPATTQRGSYELDVGPHAFCSSHTSLSLCPLTLTCSLCQQLPCSPKAPSVSPASGNYVYSAP